MLNHCIRYLIRHKALSMACGLGLLALGWGVSPFGSGLPLFEPVGVDALPDIGANQHIVFTEWAGQSPEDIEEQITYPLTTQLMGLSGLKHLRASSVFGFSTIYVTFEDAIDFYFGRARILEKLSALPTDYLPVGVSPQLGPEATPMGQVFWYTLEGMDANGNAVSGGWDLHELRHIQDDYIKYALGGMSGVAEVASIGGYAQEYQIDVDPRQLEGYAISLETVALALKRSGQNIGIQTLEMNGVEYFVRGLGEVRKRKDLEDMVVAHRQGKAIRLRDIAHIALGPAPRRGILDKEAKEAVGGVVVAQYGQNPAKILTRLKQKIKVLNQTLPKRTLNNQTEVQLQIIPFYDRSHLIKETLGTLKHTLWIEVLITMIVLFSMTFRLRSALLMAALVPFSVLVCFVAMRLWGLEANLLSLAGIAIAVGTAVDFGMVILMPIEGAMRSNFPKRLSNKRLSKVIQQVKPTLLTAAATTILCFLPIFMLESTEGKLFKPLALTKTFTLLAALLAVLFLLPAIAQLVYSHEKRIQKTHRIAPPLIAISAPFIMIYLDLWIGIGLLFFGLIKGLLMYGSITLSSIRFLRSMSRFVLLGTLSWGLARYWMPLGGDASLWEQRLFTWGMVGLSLTAFKVLARYYTPLLRRCINHTGLFLSLCVLVIAFGAMCWQGAPFVSPHQKDTAAPSSFWGKVKNTFPGLSSVFMPALDEGSFLYMPSTMPHVGIEESARLLRAMDQAAAAIPEIASVVGKLGRAETVLDPAPVSMYENLIHYHPKYKTDRHGRLLRFRTNKEGAFILQNGNIRTHSSLLKNKGSQDSLILDSNGKPFRLWRDHIKTPDDLWDEIVKVSALPGLTTAPKLHPIETRLLMLKTGHNARVSVQLLGTHLDSLALLSDAFVDVLKKVPSIEPKTIFSNPIFGKPYIEIAIDRDKLLSYQLQVQNVLSAVQIAIGGQVKNTAIEGRTPIGIRLRYGREFRDHPEALKRVRIHTPNGKPINLSAVAELQYSKGPSIIRSEDLFLTHYIAFEPTKGFTPQQSVKEADKHIKAAIESNTLHIPAKIQYRFGGQYQAQLRAEKRLHLLVPIVVLTLFLLLYLRFRSFSTALIVFTGILTALSGGFIALWLYGHGALWNCSLFGYAIGDIFPWRPIHLSTSVWVGFVALLGLATDDGLLMAGRIQAHIRKKAPKTAKELKELVLRASKERIQVARMTSATTIMALLPILTATGRGADLMIPIAIPIWGGSIVAILNYWLTPLLYYLKEKPKLKELSP